MNTSPAVASTAAVAAVIVVILIAKRRRLLRRFRSIEAIDAEHAATLQTLGMSLSASFNRLVRDKVFVAVPEGRYSLDEDVAFRLLRRKRAGVSVVAAVVFFGFLILWFSGMIR